MVDEVYTLALGEEIAVEKWGYFFEVGQGDRGGELLGLGRGAVYYYRFGHLSGLFLLHLLQRLLFYFKLGLIMLGVELACTLLATGVIVEAGGLLGDIEDTDAGFDQDGFLFGEIQSVEIDLRTDKYLPVQLFLSGAEDFLQQVKDRSLALSLVFFINHFIIVDTCVAVFQGLVVLADKSNKTRAEVDEL